MAATKIVLLIWLLSASLSAGSKLKKVAAVAGTTLLPSIIDEVDEEGIAGFIEHRVFVKLEVSFT